MATQKIKNYPEQIKQITRSMSKENFVMNPHGITVPNRSSKRFEHDQEYYIQQEGPLSISPEVNHCQLNGSGMSGCYACHYADTKQKNQCQKACNFYEKSRFHERCMWETYGEYCWSTNAQDNKKLKGF